MSSPVSGVSIFEVGPRDGLQNESLTLPLEDRVAMIQGLLKAGAREVEVGAFVRPDRVPQMADTQAVFEKVGSASVGKTRLWCLVPNVKGLERAIESKVKNIAVFTAASDAFNRSNIGMSTGRSLDEITEIAKEARKLKMNVRGYVSTAFGCPFEGPIAPKKSLKVIEKLADCGVVQVSIGDTIGVATPKGVDQLVKPAIKMLGSKKVALHFHDTRGTALANALRSLELGVTTFDSSAGGLGGCPFAPGATGNLATEDLLYMLHGMGIKTGISLPAVCEVSLRAYALLKKDPASRYLKSVMAGRRE